MHRLVSGSGDGASVRVAAPGAFRLQRYGLNGNLLHTVEPSVDWFPSGQETFTPHRTRMERPSPRINEIEVGSLRDTTGVVRFNQVSTGRRALVVAYELELRDVGDVQVIGMRRPDRIRSRGGERMTVRQR